MQNVSVDSIWGTVWAAGLILHVSIGGSKQSRSNSNAAAVVMGKQGQQWDFRAEPRTLV